MRCLIAPQEFKGVLTAVEAAEALARGVLRGRPDASLDVSPLSDGGPGLVDAVLRAVRGKRQPVRVSDPIGRPIRADWAVIPPSSTAIIEMAAASGLGLLRRDERDPRQTTTYGTGQLISAALDAECRQIIVGAGGSATNDGGAGAACALGARLLDTQGRTLPHGGAALSRLARIETAGLDPRLRRVELWIASDVQNPLCGPHGASQIYGPQKGASPQVVEELDAALQHFAEVVKATLGLDIASEAGVGAAGGLTYGLCALCGGKVRKGFETVAEFLGLQRRILEADVVLTGEGRLDLQSGYGKGPVALARLARTHHKPTVIFAGAIDRTVHWEEFEETVEVSPSAKPESTAEAEKLLEAAAETWARNRGVL